MNRFPIFRTATIFATIAIPLALPVGAYAQSMAPPPPAVSPQPSAPALTKTMSEKVETHIKALHDQLGITAAEKPQWDQFAQVMRDNAAQMEQALSARASAASANAIDNMQSYAQLTQVHATNMQKLASAFASLYNSFPDKQKAVADTVFRNSNGKTTPPKG